MNQSEQIENELHQVIDKAQKKKRRINPFFRPNNILLILIFSILCYLTYSVLTTPSHPYVDLPIIDLTKQISKLDETNRLLLEKTSIIDSKIDSLDLSIVQSKKNVINIYKNIEDEKTFIQNSNDSVNYQYFLRYLDEYSSSNN